jgi:hypothetical protein
VGSFYCWLLFSVGLGVSHAIMTNRERQLEAEVVATIRGGEDEPCIAQAEHSVDEDDTKCGGDSEDPTTSESGDEAGEEKPDFNHIIMCGSRQLVQEVHGVAPVWGFRG